MRDCRLEAPRDEAALADLLSRGRVIARGNGRAYGDSALGVPGTVSLRHFDRMIAFDAATGLLVAEAGVLLGDVIAAFLARGWFPAVTPGTKFVTLGGMIAADVHGKNHHRDGGIGAFTDWVEVMGPDGRVLRASRRENADLFALTLGGMGLSGVILRLAMRLRPVETGWIRQTTRAAPDLDTALAMARDADAATYSVAWIDCLARGAAMGRSILMLGEHAARDELPVGRAPFDTGRRRRLTVPLDAPSALLNGATVKGFNALYYGAGRRGAGTKLVDWDSFFYPLDSILGWNRIYGRRGFVQFQCVLPEDGARAGLARLLQAIGDAGQGSFLAVLKRMGETGAGRFAFPLPGWTLALDFPRAPRVEPLLDRLEGIALDHGGRFYMAKDARLRAETLHAADPRAAGFAAERAARGLSSRFASAQSERLKL